MIKIYRMINGEEILGKVVSEANEQIVIENPVSLQQAPGRSDSERPTVFFVPYAPFSNDKEVTFNKVHVSSEYEPIVDIVNKYNSIFGSGIVLAKSSDIV